MEEVQKKDERYMRMALEEAQKAYEKGLDDLKLTCDAYIEELRRKMPCEKIGPYIKECDKKNLLGLTADSVRGIATSKELIPTKANMKQNQKRIECEQRISQINNELAKIRIRINILKET